MTTAGDQRRGGRTETTRAEPQDLARLVGQLRRLLEDLLRALPTPAEMTMPRVQCRAIKVTGERCRHTSWTACLSADQFCRAHMGWLEEGRAVVRGDPGWPQSGVDAGVQMIEAAPLRARSAPSPQP